jgi:hypothetical protein
VPVGQVWLWHAHLVRDSRRDARAHSFKLTPTAAVPLRVVLSDEVSTGSFSERVIGPGSRPSHGLRPVAPGINLIIVIASIYTQAGLWLRSQDGGHRPRPKPRSWSILTLKPTKPRLQSDSLGYSSGAF